MSDDAGDKTRRDVSRGPLPRTNRPRPEHSRRAAKRDTAPSQPDTAPPQSAVIAVEAGDSATLAERPTQLDTNPRDDAPLTPHRSVTRPAITGLKRVGLSKSDARDTDKMEEPGPAGSYVGYVIDGRYRIEKIIGRGGMGVVYRAKHTVIDKLAAIKILLPTEDADVVERFVNEAKAASSIGNDHIVDTVDFGELPDGSTFFVMEHLEGQTLSKLIKQEKHISLPRALDFARQIAEGVGAAHRAGIVHRDLKPENIFLVQRDGGEFVKLLDFGIAKMQHAQNRITRAGTIFGTPHYMSPEQAAGAEVDPRTDIYSLGIILYEMLSGSVPFDAENPMGLLTQHMYTEPTPLARVEEPPQEVPLGVDAIVLKCLAKKPHGRYASMAEFVLDVGRFERGEPPVALADLLADAERREDEALAALAREGLRSGRPPKPTRWLGILVVLALVVFGAFFVFGMRRRAPGPVVRAESVAAPPATSTQVVPPPARKTVALVFSPIDGEVFREGKSLGGMPVNVAVGANERFEVEIRREGFYPKKVDVDGTRPVIVVQLQPISGVVPVVPVPSASPIDALRRKSDDNARMLAELLYDKPSLLSHGRDAGAAVAPVLTPPPPPQAPAAPTHNPPGPSAVAPIETPPVAPPPAAAPSSN
jgi:serine/threonine-protein kinase